MEDDLAAGAYFSPAPCMLPLSSRLLLLPQIKSKSIKRNYPPPRASMHFKRTSRNVHVGSIPVDRKLREWHGLQRLLAFLCARGAPERNTSLRLRPSCFFPYLLEWNKGLSVICPRPNAGQKLIRISRKSEGEREREYQSDLSDFLLSPCLYRFSCQTYIWTSGERECCLLYTSDAADER